LHWLVAALAVGVVALGWTMLAAPENTAIRERLLFWHRFLGLAILALMLFRLAWRRRHPPPPLPGDFAPLAAAFARATHRALYAVLVAMPIAGWLNAAAAGQQVRLFWPVVLPPLPAASGRLSQAAIAVHLAGQYFLYIFVSMHVAGALYHAVVRRDGVFERMLPWRRRGCL
jgi:cytochrome b561